MRTLLVTGSAGLIGSEIASYFHQQGWEICGVDNNMRADFFGVEGDTLWNRARLEKTLTHYRHFALDIRDRNAVMELLGEIKPDALVHAAAQPSHDLAARRVFDDFEVNALGTLHMLEAARLSCPEAPFVMLSTNKVYGDGPNRIAMREEETRWDYADPEFAEGIPETFGIDQCKHSLFGVSKASADLLTQEYARYFGLPACCLRGGCLTGPSHSGVELHGFLSYLIKCNQIGRPYKIYGYKGKQVRDNIHSYDVARFVDEFIKNPRAGEVYNIGGGKGNSCSILEAFTRAEAVTGKKQQYEYVDQNREGDHICYYSDLRKIKAHFPAWSLTKSLDDIFSEIASAKAT